MARSDSVFPHQLMIDIKTQGHGFSSYFPFRQPAANSNGVW